MKRRPSGPSAALACAALCVLACAAPCARAVVGPTKPTFRARVAGALGIVPPAGRQELALGSSLPLVYHGGPVMHDVTVHTIFWAPRGFAFDGPPSASSRGYQPLLEQFFTDAAHDSGATSNVFSVLPQYPDGAAAGGYNLRYAAAPDSIIDTTAYPRRGHQCASPAGIATCVTDLQLEQEVDRVIQSHNPTARGQSNVWLVFLPPDVDTCILPGVCGSNAFGGYHSSFDLGHGSTIYVNIPDPLIATTLGPGSDPQGNPDAEAAVDFAAHELVEAITDPLGNGWIDPNGNEVGDKCQSGPPRGTPLGFAPNGSPYNQVIAGEQYLLQTMWSNAVPGCVQRSTSTSSPLPLAQVRLTQFGSSVSGDIGRRRPGVRVRVTLVRAGQVVAAASTSTASDGKWGLASLKSRSPRSPHALGDDRDEIDVTYGPGGPAPDLILTGDGGNPFGQSGWTGWFDLDHGFAIASDRSQGAVALEPCLQTGVLALSIDSIVTRSPTDLCETESDVSIVPTRALTAATTLRMRSTDNRAVSPRNPDGALISLLIPLGEPNSSSSIDNPFVPIRPGGFPACVGDLEQGVARCSGLVPGAGYALTRRRGSYTVHAQADASGFLYAAGFPGGPALTGGDVLRLTNGAGRTLSVLHLAHLRVHLSAQQTTIAAGTCEPGDYYGRPLTRPPIGAGIGNGVGGSGTICPLSGDAAGLSSAYIEQTDDRSGGQTRTEVPLISDTSPVQDATIYGRFVALAGAALPGAHGALVSSRARIALTITRGSGARVVLRATNVNSPRGVAVRALPSGIYTAKWVLTDANGDTRTVRTRFVEA